MGESSSLAVRSLSWVSTWAVETSPSTYHLNPMSNENPCTSCGACCASFRVSFHWSETDRVRTGGVPLETTADLDLHRSAMLGTLSSPPRCVALTGWVGSSVACAIYERRPGVCRELEPSYRNGMQSEQCDRARLAHGLRPLTLADWELTTRPPENVPTLPRAA